MNFLRNRITILFLLALLITSGCRIIPWFGNYSDSPDPDIRGEIILSRNVEATQALSFSSPQLKLYIPAGALRYDSRVEITRYPLLLSKLNLPEEYRPASQLFSIDVLPAITTLSQAATLKFSIANAVAGRSYMAAYRGSDEKWKFASPLQQNQTNDLVVETLSFSDWLIVERVKSFPGALAQGMQITASPTAAVASTTGFFEEDIEISLNLHSDNLLSLNQASSILKMQLSNYNKFSLTVANPGAPTTSREFNSDADNSVFIDLLNTSLASAQVEGSNATYTFRIALKGKTPAELPDFLALEALYTTVNGISYSAAQTLTFSEAPDESGDIKPTAPQITDSLPENGANYVASNTEIKIVFDQNMNIDTIQAAIKISDRAGNAVSGSFHWENDRIMVFVPNNLLLPSTEYVIRFVDGATGENGLALVVEGEMVFTTISNEPAELLNYSPENNTLVEYNTPIILSFSQPIDANNLNFTITPEIPGGYATTWNKAKTEVSIIYGSGFASGLVYTVNVLNTSKDIYGQPIIDNYSFSFTSKTYTESRLTVISPASGSVGIAPTSDFVLTFDKAMDHPSVESAITFSPMLTGVVSYVWSPDSMKLTIAHTEKLQLSKDYYLSIAQNDTNLLITSYQISFQTVNALQVIETTPANNTAGVTTAQTVEFRFNNQIDTETLAVSFSPEPTNGFTQSWSDNNTRLLLTPSPALDESRNYQVSILTATSDVYGSTLGQNHVLDFSTGAFTQPQVTSTLPENNSLAVTVNQQIKIYFNKSMDKTKTQAALTIQPFTSPEFSWQDSGKTMLIDFAAPLTAGTTYAFTLNTEATDQTGLKLAQPYTLSLKTAAPDSPNPATLTEYEPTDSSTPVDIFAPVVLRFSAPIDQKTLDFEISPAIAGDFSTTWNEAGTEVSVRFNSGYSSGISYTFSVLATTKDIYGQNIAEPDDFNFTAKTYVATRLIGVSPASGSAGIDPSSTFELTFDQAMNEGDIVAAISFSPALTGAVNYAWSDGSKKLTITHTDKLLLGTNYLVTIAQSYANQLISSYAISYKVAEALQIVETTPEDSSTVTINQPVEFKFNNQIDTETLAVSFSPEPTNGFTQNWSENNTRLLLTPSPALDESRSYQVSILVATKDIYGNSLPQSHILAFSTGAVTQPEVTLTLPANNSLAVAVNQQIRIYFSKSMNKAITQTALNIQPPAIPTFSWQDSDSTMLIDFAAPLSADTTYAFTLSTEATDQTGLKLAQPYTLSLKTAAPDSPDPTTLTGYEPADSSTPVDLFAPVVLRFSAPIDQKALNFEILPTIAGDFSTTWNEAGTEVSVRFNSGYGSGISYTFSVLATTKDIYGQNIAEPDDFNFTAETYVATRLIGVSPASGSVGIAPSSTFELTFDQGMNESEVVNAISYSPALTGTVNYAWSDGSKKLSITHTDKLLLGTNYLITIAQSYANRLISSYAISYKVAEALQVVENTPENNAAGVTTSQNVKFIFNNPINTGTLALSFSPEPTNGFTQSWSDNNRILLLTPNNPGLVESTSYQVSILVATEDIYGNSLPQSHILAFSTGAVTQPEVTSTLPANNSLAVAVSQQIKIYFSKSMNKAITQTALSIQPPVSPTFSWQDSDSTMLMDFAAPLAADTTYAFTLSTEATDQTGLKLAQPYTLSFKTAAPDSPDLATLTGYEPADNSTPVDLFAPVVLRFSAPIDQETLNFEISPPIAGDFSTTWNEAGTEVSVRFNSGYSSGISYTFSVLATTKDIYGQNIAESYDFNFTAITYVAARLIGTIPASGTAGIAPDSTFELTFDQAMNESDVVNAISFSPALTGAVNYAWSDGSKKLTITHTDKLLLGTNYLITIAQSYANRLISSYAISYKVAEALQVVETTPESASTVTTSQPVEFKFNNPINTETLALAFSPEPANGFTQNWSDNNRI
ncbi:MAG: Ig-like domain-containing protein, partial [Candidatus Riflebacteria bacterium]|nr:Ig-like domain-containing protein [Candidatus Riflebacteria bacterium]